MCLEQSLYHVCGGPPCPKLGQWRFWGLEDDHSEFVRHTRMHIYIYILWMLPKLQSHHMKPKQFGPIDRSSSQWRWDQWCHLTISVDNCGSGSQWWEGEVSCLAIGYLQLSVVHWAIAVVGVPFQEVSTGDSIFIYCPSLGHTLVDNRWWQKSVSSCAGIKSWSFCWFIVSFTLVAELQSSKTVSYWRSDNETSSSVPGESAG